MKLRRMVALAAGAALISVVVAVGASGHRTAGSPAPAFTASQLVQPAGDDWITWNGNIFNQRYSSLNQISIDNVKDLKVAFKSSVVLPGVGKKGSAVGLNAEGAPIEYQGVMYLPDPKYNVYAFSATTGERLWSFHPTYPHGGSQAPLAIDLRGVAIGEGKVFTPLPDASIVALDQATGRPVWRKTVANWKDGYSFTNAPIYYNGMVITGETGGDAGAACKLIALDAKTGKILWQFKVIPTKKGEAGFNTWPLHRAWVGGGAMWNTPVVDPALGLVYVGVGNPIPYAGITRGPGKELWTESIVAVNASNGKLKWGYQEVHHDIWDYDTTNPIILYDLTYNGKLRHALVQANKNGWLYILDRATGKPILGIPEKKMMQSKAAHTYATQPIPKGQPFANQCPANRQAWAKLKAPDGKPFVVGCTYLPYDTSRFTVSAPSFLGGADWPPSAFSPQTGYMYICSKESSQVWAAEEPGKLSKLGNFQQIKSLPKGFKSPVGDVTGTLVAMNLRTNRIAWKRQWKNDICYSGVTATAGGLVFVGRDSARLQAYDAKNGTLVWTSPKLPGAADAPPMVYMANGKEYVAVYAGGNGLASGLFSGLHKPRFSKYMVVFSL